MSCSREVKTRGEERVQLHTALAPGGDDSGQPSNMWKYQQSSCESSKNDPTLQKIKNKKKIFDMNFKEFVKERLRGDLITGSKWTSFWFGKPRLQGLESEVGHLSLEVRHFPDSKDN